ncbi:DUF1064 domain-containing protein [Caenorhabditis elegans]|uniref:DUF1064 domain-containing protein n=1 Tax=Caenorhabditis elegans TaxID=6239 RepID=C8JQS8_CAEEL|nr:DUF1064 domain-containing protein [Caenorhabditis elegans]CBB16117.1 DUF1064 domain-containing protein [Caenorhabditis elegans]|eukprot:NP_001256701.1 Uncharacterized protein CELE_F11A5.18 [Caenorhabditis elegans]
MINPNPSHVKWSKNNSTGPHIQKKEVRNTIKQLLYQHKAKRNYIDYLCKTAVEQEIFNEADAEKIRSIYWKIDKAFYFGYLNILLLDPEYKEYKAQNVDPEGIVKLKVFSDKYLEDKKQDALLRWKYIDS